jgi:hypothetical protein
MNRRWSSSMLKIWGSCDRPVRGGRGSFQV